MAALPGVDSQFVSDDARLARIAAASQIEAVCSACGARVATSTLMLWRAEAVQGNLDFIGDCVNEDGSVLGDADERAEVLQVARNDLLHALDRAEQLRRELAALATHERRCRPAARHKLS